MKTKFLHLLLLCLILGTASCAKNRISGSTNNGGGGGSIYSNPDALTFSPEHHAYMLRLTYLQLAYTFPPQSALDEIASAANSKDANKAYADAIDTLVNSGEIKERLIDYGINITGVGNKYTGTESQRYPANLFAYVVLTGKKIDEFLLADYAISDAGNVVTQTYTGGPPTSAQAGYITMEEYAKKYMDTRFMFKMIREILGTNLITKAPFNNVNIFRWEPSQMNPKYVSQENNTTVCLACHSYMNPLRGAFHKYNGAYNTYNAGTAQGTNQYGQEDSNGNPLEPPQNNTPL
ncbi:MAG: hypothetical protein IT286_03485 [Proteobacteria bacterium]|nr:hypothetical protein [Pseudomonadota bacterium]